jgi:hypothetical protein
MDRHTMSVSMSQVKLRLARDAVLEGHDQRTRKVAEGIALGVGMVQDAFPAPVPEDL